MPRNGDEFTLFWLFGVLWYGFTFICFHFLSLASSHVDECTIIKNSERLLFNELVEFNEKETDRGTDKTNSARIDFMSCSLISCA